MWIKICNECKSENVVFDAWARWDKSTQQMELKQTFDEAYCIDCASLTSVDDIEVEELIYVSRRNKDERI